MSVSDAEGVVREYVKNLVPSETDWLASSLMGDVDTSGIILWGGLNGKNEREGSGWIFRME